MGEMRAIRPFSIYLVDDSETFDPSGTVDESGITSRISREEING